MAALTLPEFTLRFQALVKRFGVFHDEPSGVWDTQTQEAYLWFLENKLNLQNARRAQQPQYFYQMPVELQELLVDPAATMTDGDLTAVSGDVPAVSAQTKTTPQGKRKKPIPIPEGDV